MESNTIELGKNRTGVMKSPIDAAELIEGLALQDTVPMPDVTADTIRADFASESDAVGSMPLPLTAKGVIGTALGTMSGNRLHILLDKLGQRAAYERTGVRLYDAFIGKAALLDDLPPGMSIAAVQEIRDEEAAHFVMLTDAIAALGGDAMVQAPCADMSGVQGMGLVQAMNEPRATLSQALEVLLAAELIDEASWELLIDLTDQSGYDKLSERFNEALETENSHLEQVRSWLAASLEADASMR